MVWMFKHGVYVVGAVMVMIVWWWWTISPRGYHSSSCQRFGIIFGLLNISIIEIYSS